LTFASGEGAVNSLIERLLANLETRSNPRILDLGCGGGGLTVAAARARPDATLVGLDISAVNIAEAQRACDRAGFSARIATVCTDYLTWQNGTFDAIVSDSVLYVVVGSDEALAKRLAADLCPGGVLVASFPIESGGNTFRVLLRRLWRLLPKTADRLPLVIAGYLYPDFTKNALADRVGYLRVLPMRLYGPHITTVFGKHGLEVIEATKLKNPSIAKLTHRLVVWRKRT